MNTGRAVILNPSRPDSVQRREFLINSLRKSGLEWSQDIEESRITITWQAEPKRGRPSPVSRSLPCRPQSRSIRLSDPDSIASPTISSTGMK
jgi:hypothetical protein